jgi:hypothetical protein
LTTILKLLVAVAVLNAVGRGGMAAWDYYQLRDGAERLLVFDLQSTPDELKTQILEMGNRLELPVAAENVSVEREGARTTATVAYTQPVEFFPSVVYPIPFSFTVNEFSTGPLKPGAAP